MISEQERVRFTAACPWCEQDAEWTCVRRERQVSFTEVGTQAAPPRYEIACDCEAA